MLARRRSGVPGGAVDVMGVLDQQAVAVEGQHVDEAVAALLLDAGVHDDRGAQAVRLASSTSWPRKVCQPSAGGCSRACRGRRSRRGRAGPRRLPARHASDSRLRRARAGTAQAPARLRGRAQNRPRRCWRSRLRACAHGPGTRPRSAASAATPAARSRPAVRRRGRCRGRTRCGCRPALSPCSSSRMRRPGCAVRRRQAIRPFARPPPARIRSQAGWLMAALMPDCRRRRPRLRRRRLRCLRCGAGRARLRRCRPRAACRRPGPAAAPAPRGGCRTAVHVEQAAQLARERGGAGQARRSAQADAGVQDAGGGPRLVEGDRQRQDRRARRDGVQHRVQAGVRDDGVGARQHLALRREGAHPAGAGALQGVLLRRIEAAAMRNQQLGVEPAAGARCARTGRSAGPAGCRARRTRRAGPGATPACCGYRGAGVDGGAQRPDVMEMRRQRAARENRRPRWSG
jgi:hypothetical protein